MKNIKTFESLKSFLNKQSKFSNKLKYNVGDYVLFTRSWRNIINEPVIIVSLFSTGYHCRFVNKQADGTKSCNVLEEEVIRKLTDLEVASIKYNL